jgi:hypothetical protein
VKFFTRKRGLLADEEGFMAPLLGPQALLVLIPGGAGSVTAV